MISSTANDSFKFPFSGLKKHETHKHSDVYNLFITFINMNNLKDYIFGIDGDINNPVPIPSQPKITDAYSEDKAKNINYNKMNKKYTMYMNSNSKAFLAVQILAGEDYRHCITSEMVNNQNTIAAFQSLASATFLNKSTNASFSHFRT
jgi:hypothetical protein